MVLSCEAEYITGWSGEVAGLSHFGSEMQNSWQGSLGKRSGEEGEAGLGVPTPDPPSLDQKHCLFDAGLIVDAVETVLTESSSSLTRQEISSISPSSRQRNKLNASALPISYPILTCDM